jgi:hypothetical protein
MVDLIVHLWSVASKIREKLDITHGHLRYVGDHSVLKAWIESWRGQRRNIVVYLLPMFIVAGMRCGTEWVQNTI